MGLPSGNCKDSKDGWMALLPPLLPLLLSLLPLLPLLLLSLPVPSGAQEPPHTACSQNTNKSCELCLKNVSCLWCNSNNACLDYPLKKILPPGSICKLSSARWGVCWVNFEALIITMSVVGGALLIGVFVCCCCCCRKKKSKKPDKDEERAARERDQRKVRQEERRAEMKTRHEEIRKKYGLFKEENPYAKFENN
ncbi:pituitary tumor-transforming gene 1 protein-interacting protein [Tachyglossus aculeatus]|uniref:pituitary tumor-transforming gene 1 protein-interacting protein n=1 Tax=Tachyglossus aculeatus TaxID=9261 RepID=UPI0018F27F8C|nr:pituitary tumor-transforming gene 1 protein-interacting protein [Tachyglossus aculeatus]